MHIILGLLSAVTSLLWIVYRLRRVGIDVTALNPVVWKRRRQWTKKLNVKAIYQLRQPMEAAALLVTGIASFERPLSAEAKADLEQLFEEEFQISKKEAVQLLSSSLFLLREATNLIKEVRAILAPTKAQYEEDQITSLHSMLKKGAALNGKVSMSQERLIATIVNEFE